MKDALLGYSGFVGSHIRENLCPSQTDYFNSENIQDVAGKEFRYVYSACAPSVKWRANANPDEDAVEIDTLKNILISLKCDKFFHISTIDIHSPEVLDQVEDEIVPATATYGKNRYHLEVFLRQHFDDKLVILRLPALFGVGLKKNYLYDLMNKNNLEKVNINSSFQWYSLSWLWGDIKIAQEDGRKTVNLYTESIETNDIIDTFFPDLSSSVGVGTRVFYSQSSKYGGRTAKEVLEAMTDYLLLEAMKNKSVTNRMVVSNMAWKKEHNQHVAFLMDRYGINLLEILPTKLGTWDDVFQNNLEEQLDVFREYGITVYSVQSIFHGVEGRFGDDGIEKHLQKIVKFCEAVGAEVIVMGSPTMRGKNCDRRALADLLERSGKDTSVKICLEPNSKAYRCSAGTTLDECVDIRGPRKFSLNYDTGNAYMEKDRLPQHSDGIAHIQISNALLNPMKHGDYQRLVDSGVCGAVGQLLDQSKDLKISLEVCMHDNIKLFGEQIRRFAGFYVKYYA